MLEVTDDNNSSYKSPYDDFVCQVCTMYNSYRIKSPITTNTYLFFLPYTEEPIFVMDSEGSYLCGKYEIKNFDDGTHCHVVNSWLLSDLFCTRYGYIDDDAESKNDLKIAVDNIEKYVSFENLISKMQ